MPNLKLSKLILSRYILLQEWYLTLSNKKNNIHELLSFLFFILKKHNTILVFHLERLLKLAQ